jgi:NitT/TauT family transport system ATP-binding protein
MYQITVDSIDVAFPAKGGGVKMVVNDVSLRVRKGEFITLMGPSGAGKTVLMKSVYGSNRPARGLVQVGGEVVRRVSRHRGMVYQTYSLFPHLTVLENIALGPLLEHTSLPNRLAYAPLHLLEEVGFRGLLDRVSPLDKVPVWGHYRRVRQEALTRARTYLARIGLTEADGSKYPHELSGGMRQRVAVAQALMMNPDVLFMDEAFGALDPIVRKEMQEWLLQLWKELGITIFFVTHDEEEGLYMCTRFVALSQYWSNNDGTPGVGAKIVYDIAVPNRFDRNDDWRNSAEFHGILAKMRQDAMNKERRQKLSECELSHPDALPHAA